MAKVKCVGKSGYWDILCDYLTIGKEYEVTEGTEVGGDLVYLLADDGDLIAEYLPSGNHGYILEWVNEEEPMPITEQDKAVEAEDVLWDESGSSSCGVSCGSYDAENFSYQDWLDERGAVDMVNSPSHYNTGGTIECIDYIRDFLTKEEYIGYLRGNIAKYLHRFPYKNGLEDVKKAGWYRDRLEEVLQDG